MHIVNANFIDLVPGQPSGWSGHEAIPFGLKIVSRQSTVKINSLTLLVLVVIFYGEFDPGSGRTLAACLTHASRTMIRSLLL